MTHLTSYKTLELHMHKKSKQKKILQSCHVFAYIYPSTDDVYVSLYKNLLVCLYVHHTNTYCFMFVKEKNYLSPFVIDVHYFRVVNWFYLQSSTLTLASQKHNNYPDTILSSCHFYIIFLQRSTQSSKHSKCLEPRRSRRGECQSKDILSGDLKLNYSFEFSISFVKIKFKFRFPSITSWKSFLSIPQTLCPFWVKRCWENHTGGHKIYAV